MLPQRGQRRGPAEGRGHLPDGGSEGHVRLLPQGLRGLEERAALVQGMEEGWEGWGRGL